MTIDKNPVIITFLIYMLAMISIGVWACMRTGSLSDYILGGRKLGRWVAALSACASDMSGWLLLGLPGYAYSSGMESLWLAGGLLAGTYMNWRVLAQRLRRYTEAADDALTLPAFFEKRFNDRRHILRVISALFILVFFLFYTSSGLVAGGKLFQTVFGLPYDYAVAGGALTIVAYTYLGGFLAVSWTDMVQGLLMAAALLVVPAVVIDRSGYALLGKIGNINPELLSPFTDKTGKPMTLVAVLSLAGWGLGYFGQPHILARFKAIGDPEDIPGARKIAVSWTALTLTGATLAGLAGIVYQRPPLSGADTEKIFMLLVSSVFHPVIAGILLAAILAAIMSTADSQLLVSSSALSEDFYKAIFRKDAGQKEFVRIGRIAVTLIALLAYLLALDPESRVLDLVAYAWAGFGAAFGPALILALFWRRMNRQGALAGIVTGGLTVVVWKQLKGGIFDLYELVPGFIFSVLAIVSATLFTGEPEKEVLERHDRISGK